ncbi:hypothetical protein BDN72DRAFT_420096 [Pluteus cervinus]|uniref:Uncharacterized protein n=1 Tax=Pluteus cervinus TaxID=181527 RepID=A0ACD3A8B3_9AGAR|nr:hypothetical protein BDN72DRAFT_420096 [Pluteus cervinus]
MLLLSLPFDILIRLLSIVEGSSLLKCREVCKTFAALIETDIGLQYKLELYRSGMLNNSSEKHAGVSFRQRLDLLKQLHSLRQTWSVTWPEGLIPGTRSTANIEDWSWEYTSKILACLTVDSEVCLYEFFGLSSTIPYRHRVVHPQPQFGLTQGLYLDPRQDLLIVMDSLDNLWGTELRVHVLSLSDGLPHPQANKPIIEVHNLFYDASGLFQSQIYGNLLAVGVVQDNLPTGNIGIINWITGELIETIPGYAYMFLDGQHILLAHLNDALSRVELRVHVITGHSDGSRPLLVLPMPIPYRDYSLRLGIDQHQDDALTTTSNPTNMGDLDTNRYPFIANPALNMVALSLSTSSRGPSPIQIICAFPLSSILTLLPAPDYTSYSEAHTTPIEIPWGSWAQCTFTWPTILVGPKMCLSISGNRIAISQAYENEPDTDTDNTCTVSIYRFHPEWFTQQRMTPQNSNFLGGDLDKPSSGLELDDVVADIGMDMDNIVTLPLPKPEQVMTTGEVRQIWMDDDLLVMALPEGIQFVRA